MVERRMQLIEEPSGTGEVYKHDRWLARVRYSLVVQQEVLVLGSESGAEELPGLIRTYGQIEILGGERELIANHEGPYRLRLSDGRTWDFRATETIVTPGVYRTANAAALGLH
jgi:hypothetical protein